MESIENSVQYIDAFIFSYLYDLKAISHLIPLNTQAITIIRQCSFLGEK